MATAGGSVLASQDVARKERVCVVAVQPQYTAGQPSIRVEIRCPLDMSRGQRISTRISVVYHCRLYCAAHFLVNTLAHMATKAGGSSGCAPGGSRQAGEGGKACNHVLSIWM